MIAGATKILDDFRRKVCGEFQIEQESPESYVVYVPFMFDSGDHYAVFLKRDGDQWYFTDEGETLMELDTHGVDVGPESRVRKIARSLEPYGLADRSGEFRVEVSGEDFGPALFAFIQGVSKVVAVPKHTEREKAPFRKALNKLIRDTLPRKETKKKWHDEVWDPSATYLVDYKFQKRGDPWFIFGVASDNKCRDAALTCTYYREQHYPFHSLAIFSGTDGVHERAREQLTRVVEVVLPSVYDTDHVKSTLSKIGAE